MAVPPIAVQLWTDNGSPRLLNVCMGLEAAERVYNESVAKLRTGETIRVMNSSEPH